MAQPKPSTHPSNTYAEPHSDSETSPTTSPAASSKQEDSDTNYPLNYEEPDKGTGVHHKKNHLPIAANDH